MSESVTAAPAAPVAHQCSRSKSSLGFWLLVIALVMAVMLSAFLCVALAIAVSGIDSTPTDSVVEQYESGARLAADKVAIIDIVGTISPPLTGRVLDQVEHATEDDNVKAVLLRIDSPGGLVADSHQIYHRLKALSDAKPVYASFGRLAASGGYYVAMGVGEDGKIFTEPTTWTGSIGVIIPHYEVKALADKWGVEVKPLTTGPYKDALSPFKDISADEQKLWNDIIGEAYDRFVGVIDDNRPALDNAAVLEAATGQIFTSQQALTRNLVDVEGFEEDAVETLIADHSLGEVQVVRYGSPPSLLDVLYGSVKAPTPAVTSEAAAVQKLTRALTPQPLYLFGWPHAEL